MKKITLIFLIFFLWTCGGGGGSSPTEPVEPPSIVINLTSLAGQAQKGPFSNGTSINVAELSSTLAPTGRNFSTAITDNSGRFSVANVQLESPYVELRANGFYFDEVANELSDAQLTLFSLSNLTGKTSLNVNILTHLEKNRIINLMSNSTALTFSQAKIQSQEEVLNIFDFSRSNMPDSELLDISKNGESNAKLLAISAIIQGQLSVAQMSELLANISTDISTDGTLNNQELMDTLITNSQNLDMPEIRANLIARYASLGISATIPDFETEINQFLKPPIANDMSLSVDEDTSINVTLDASDPEGDELTFSIVETNNGSVTLNGNVANYTPNTNFNGTDTFTYFANDGTSNSNTATVTVEVGAVDDEPQTNDIDVQTDEDIALVFNLSADEYDGDSYSFAIITNVSNGTTSLNGSVVTYTPNQDFNGEDTLTFEATDDRTLRTNIATATITVNPINDAPVANDITNQVTDENRMMQLDITLDATDVDGDVLNYSVTSTNNGSVTINDNIATYVSTQDWNGTDTFTYVANDGSLDSNTATVTITVNSVNDAPVASDNNNVTTNEDTAKDITLDATDVDGDVLNYSVTSTNNGSVTINDNIATYVSTQDWNGTDTFTYVANDGSLDSNTATVTITVNSVNDAPVTTDISTKTEEDTNLLIHFEDGVNIIDIDNEIAQGGVTGIIVSLPTNGKLYKWNGDDNTPDTTVLAVGDQLENSAGLIKAWYVSNSNYNGTDTFTYKANDGTDDGNISTVTITINATDDEPNTNDVSAETDEDTALEINLIADEYDGDSYSFSIVSDPSNGTVSLSETTATYTPNQDWYGMDTFTFEATDDTGRSRNVATATITVNAVNDAPTAVPVSKTMDEDGGTIDVETNYGDVDGDSDLTFTLVDAPSNGTATVGIPGTYTPNANFNGTDTFTYTVSDAEYTSAPATVTITVNSVNDTPVASDLNVTTNEDTAKEITLLGSDIDGDTLTYSITGQLGNGSISLDGDIATYTPNTNFNGTDTFTYVTNDGTNNSNTAIVTVNVTAINDAPVASDVSVSTNEDTVKTFNLVGTDIEGATGGGSHNVTYSIVSNPSNGSLSSIDAPTVNGASITYTPTANWNGTDTFTYKVNDDTIDSNTATVTITVAPINDAPITLDMSENIDEDNSINLLFEQGKIGFPTGGFAGTDVDDGQNLTFYLLSLPANGNLSINGSSVSVGDALNDISSTLDTNVLYTPNANWNGTDTFTFKANDGALDGNVGTVTVTINPVDDEPVTNNIIVEVDEDNSTDITLTAEEYDGDNYSFSITDQPSNGSTTISGVVATYTPNENYNGIDSFTFEATDDTGRSMNVATATITINPVNDVPVTSDISTAMEEDTNIVINLVASDIENDDLTFNIESIPSNGSATVIDDNVSYSPNSDYSGTDTFTYSANDGELTSNISTVTITIADTNDAPTVEDIRVTLNENRLINSIFDEKENSDIKFTIKSNKSGSTDITLTGSDPDGDSLVFSIVETNTGAVSLDNNIATYTPSQDWNGVDTFSFKAFDGVLESNIAKVILTVNPQNDAPTVTDLSITTSEDTDIEFILDGTDIDGDNLTYSIITDVGIGDNNITLENNTGPSVLFEPGDDWYGTEQFTYMTNDGSLDSNTAQVTLVVSPVNDAPTANDVTATVSETRTARSYFSLDANDVDGDNLEYVIVSNVSNGTVSLNGAEINYVPNQNFVGQDTLTYKANDGILDSNIASSFITVSAVNDTPVAEEIYSSVDEDSSVEITLKASDVESESLNYYVSKSSSNATLEQTASKITYSPNTDFNGYDSFMYYAVDEESQVSNIATVHVNVNPMEDGPKLEDADTTIYYTLEYGVPDTISFTNFPDVDPDGDAVTYYFYGDSTKYSFSSATQDTLYCIDCYGANAASIYGIDDRGNQGANSAFTVNLIGGPQGLSSVEEYTAGYVENNELRDTSVSYIPFASLGRTGYIIENRAGEVNVAPYARDFDRFNYWTEPSQFHIELDFSQESLAWDYIAEYVNSYVPFTAYLIDAFDNSKEQLFAGYWDRNANGTFDIDGDNWTGPVYGAASWEPIYLFLPQDGVVYGNEAQYLAEDDLTTSGGIGYGSSNPRELRSSLDFGDPPSVAYPLMTATLFTDYLGSGVLPTADGLVTYGSEWIGASSVVFKTSFEIYDNPDGTNNSRNSIENTFDRSSEEVLLPQMNLNRKFSSDEFINGQGIER